MVQFNPKLNVGKTSKLTSAVQVGKAGAPDDKQPPKAETKAVWVENLDHIPPSEQKDYNAKLGDVRILIWDNKVRYQRLTINAQGEEVWTNIRADDVQDSDYQRLRGDIRR